MTTIDEVHALRDNPIFMEAFQGWWDEDFSVESLANRPSGVGDYSVFSLWAPICNETFEFAGREWLPFHMPPFDPDGNINEEFNIEDLSDSFRQSQISQITNRHKSEMNSILSGCFLTSSLFEQFDFQNFDLGHCILPDGIRATGLVTSQFKNCIFVGVVQFQQCNFMKGASFQHSRFLDKVIFTGAAIGESDGDFSHCMFRDYVEFSNISTDKVHLTFADSKFRKSVRMEELKLDSSLILDDVVCNDQFTIAGTIGQQLQVNHSHFQDFAVFTTIVVGTEHRSTESSFVDTIFQRSAFFPLSVFYSRLTIQNCVFNGEAAFWDGCFAADTVFKKCDFLDRTSFIGRHFRERTRFSAINFCGTADFSGRPLERSDATNRLTTISFGDADAAEERCVFHSEAKFDNRDFIGATSFAFAIFHSIVSFHKSNLHPDTTFVGAQFFNDIRRQRLIATKFSESELAAMENGFRSLKNASQQIGARNDQYRFHALELECRRTQSSTPFMEKLVSSGYRQISNYGESIRSPAVSLIQTAVVFWLVYMGIGWAVLRRTYMGRPDASDTVIFTVSQFTRPFSLWNAKSAQSWPDWVQCISKSDWFPLLALLTSIQSMIGLATVALLLFSIRRRFQIG